ncbi:MAG TPA: siderophore-interacting protein [Candidatus Dormibacteraeota bacterium]|nr:siderophore-interacting protein [Candidatus Dormibacteraeota bacterium]
MSDRQDVEPNQSVLLPVGSSPLPPPQSMSLTVVEVVDLGPSLRQIRLGGEDLIDFTFAPGQDLMLRLPRPNGELISRRYTIRGTNPRAGQADLNVVMHGDGPAARWARAAQPGQQLAEVVGPRGKITIDPDADWHLFLGDETYIAGTLAMLEALPTSASAQALLEVSTGADEQPFASRAGIHLDWLRRVDEPPGDADRLLHELRRWQAPPGRGHVYIAAELRVALTLRDEVLGGGLPRDQISAKGYWSRGRANASRGEPDDPA